MASIEHVVDVQLLLSLLLVFLSRGLVARMPERAYFRWWTWGWLAFAVLLFVFRLAILPGTGEVYRHYIYPVIAAPAAFLQVVFFWLGAETLRRGESMDPRWSRWAIALAVGLGLLLGASGFARLPDADLSLAIRSLPRNLGLMIVFPYCAYVFKRHNEGRAPLATNVTVAAFALYGFGQLLYTVSHVDHILAATAGWNLVGTGVGVMLSGVAFLADIVWEATIGVGTLLLIIQDRERALAGLQESERKYRHLYTRTPTMLHSVDANNRIVEVSERWLENLGYEREEVIGRKTAEFLTEDARQVSESIDLPKFLETRWVRDVHRRFLTKGGGVRDVLVSSVAETDEKGHFLQAITALNDVTEQMRAQRAVAESEMKFRGLFESANDGIVLADANGSIVDANPTMLRLMGYERNEILGLNLSDLHPPEMWEQSLDITKLQDKSGLDFETSCVRKDGSTFPAEFSASIFELDDRPALLASIRDISKRKELEKELRRRALHHPLTDLPNRAYFAQELARAVARMERGGPTASVLFLDLDEFKSINDTLGHHAGDLLLVAVAGKLADGFRNADMVAHMGGDEFTVLLESCSTHAAARTVGERVASLFDKPFDLDGTELRISVSIGVAVGSQADNPEMLVQQADSAMYRAKKRAGNSVCVYGEDEGAE